MNTEEACESNHKADEIRQLCIRESASDPSWTVVINSGIKFVIQNIESIVMFSELRKGRSRREQSALGKWSDLIRNPQTRNPSSYEGKTFRLRFRVAFTLFEEYLVPFARKHHFFSKFHTSYIPVELKVLIGLRYLGRGSDGDTLSELFEAPQSTCYTIVQQFCKGLPQQLAPLVVKFPSVGGREMQMINNAHEKLGFPGACGSMDATHFRWDKCPSSQFNIHKGRYSHPTLAIQAIVDHNRMFLHVSEVYPGSFADKTIAVNTPLTYDIMHRKALSDVKFDLHNEDNTVTQCAGGYLLVDGGYHKRACFIDPLHSSTGFYETFFSELLESVRKDVECSFGILKQRFRVLKNPIQNHSAEEMTCVIRACITLHNLLLEYDGLDQYIDWAVADPDMDPHQESNNKSQDETGMTQGWMQTRETVAGTIHPTPERTVAASQSKQQRRSHPNPSMESMSRGIQFHASENHYNRLRKALVVNFKTQHKLRKLLWPKACSTRMKSLFPLANEEQ